MKHVDSRNRPGPVPPVAPEGPPQSAPDAGGELPPETLLEIIRLQTEIVKLGLDLGSVMNFAADQLRALTHAAGAIVELAEGEDMVYRAVSGIASRLLGLRLRREGSLSGLCVASGAVLYCDDSETDPRVDKAACRTVGLRSMVVAPLRHQDTVVGALKILSPNPLAFSPAHGRILLLVSELIAAAMYYAAKYEIDDLYHRATHDVLTGLANRALFYDHLRQAMALAHRRKLCMGVMNLDMDGLKCINDRFGHQAGDAAIQETALRIKRAARESDLVARLGGDEFAVILPDVLTRINAQTIADRMAGEIRRPFRHGDVALRLDASIGLALFPEDAVELEALMEKADRTMYADKRSRQEVRGSGTCLEPDAD